MIKLRIVGIILCCPGGQDGLTRVLIRGRREMRVTESVTREAELRNVEPGRQVGNLEKKLKEPGKHGL